MAVPRFVHGGRLWRPRPLAQLARATRLPRPRYEPGARADVEALRRGPGDLHLRLARVHLRHLAHSGSPAAQPPERAGRGIGPELQHVRLLRYQHQLAELRGRDDHVVLLSDWRAHGPAVRLTGRGHRRCHRHGARIRSPQVAHDRQLLGRHDPLHALHPLAGRLRLWHHLRWSGCRGDIGRHGNVPRRAQQRHPNHCARTHRIYGGDQAAGHQWRRLSQPKLVYPLRESFRPNQLPLDVPACSAFPLPLPTPSARWWAASSTAPPCWRRW